MIGLEDILYLVKKYGEDFRFVRVLACDVLEMRLLAGQSQVLPRRKLVVGVTLNENGHLSIGDGFSRPTGHIIPNGILELHNGRFLGGIQPYNGVQLAEDARGERKGVFALVGFERDDELEKALYWFCEDKWVLVVKDESGYLNSEWWFGTLESKDCLHRFVKQGTTGLGERTQVIEYCDYCDEMRSRPALPEEQLSLKDHAALHKTAHAFQRLFRGDDDGPQALELHGYEAMEKAEAFASEHPHDVQIVGVDDSHFTGSDLVLINHRGDSKFMGTTVYFIPQNGGHGAEFFLYPEHRKALARALDLIARQQAAEDPT
jgi:hypothetical protein